MTAKRADRRFLPLGLRWRLTAWVASVLLISAAVVFLVVYNSTGSQLTGQINRAVTVDSNQLAQALRTRGGATPRELAARASRYLAAQPFSTTSTLLFVIIPGAVTASNHPELFSQAGPDSDESPQDQGRERQEGRQLEIPRLGFSTQVGPDLGRIRIFERAVTIGAIRVVAGAGQPLDQVEAAQHSVGRAFLIAGAAAIVIVLLASYLAGARVSAPLRRMASVASRVDAGDLNPRMDVNSTSADEVQVLGDAFNNMLDRLAEAFARQREFVADASHELRTPITVIRGQLEVLAAQSAPSADEVERVNRLVQAEIARTTRLIEDLLVLAQADRVGFLRLASIDISPFVEELWDGVSLTAERQFELGPVPAGSLIADPDRLAQALRNLARNAIEHTAAPSGLVRLEVARAAGERIRFSIIDDGPGIPASERELIFERFHRTDPARSRANGGAGLGLAIVRAIAVAHTGEVHAADGPGGRGARLELVLPRFRPA